MTVDDGKVNIAETVGDVSSSPYKPGKLLMCKSYQMGVCKRAASECKYAHHAEELDPVSYLFLF